MNRKNNRRQRRIAQKFMPTYALLEAKQMLAGVLGGYEPQPIADPFAADAVTVKQMTERAAVHPFMAGQLVVAVATQQVHGRLAVQALDWSEMTGVAETRVIRQMMSVDRGGNSITLVHLDLGAKADIFAAMGKLDGYRRVMWSSPNFYTEKDPREFVPNDPQYASQYHHALMQNDLAWDITLGSPNIVIGVTDDGVELFHSDLLQNIYINSGEVPLDGEDNDGNGYIDDDRGWDFASNNNDPNPNSSGDTHGTHVGGIAAGRTHNAVGIAGTAGRSKIMALQFYGGGAWTAAMINETFTYAANNGAHIVNTSYNIDGWVGDPVFTAGLQYLYDEGVLHFNSAGNNGQLNPARQAFEQTLLVASTNASDQLSGFSNYGVGVDLSAPGSDILSTVTGNGYSSLSGTSMAAPNAAGAAALIWSAHPTWNRDQVAAALFANADNIDAQNPTRVGLLGGGRVNSFKGITVAVGAAKVRDVGGLPANGAFLDDTTISTFSVAFNQIMDPASVNNPANFELRSSGLDGVFDTADDQVFTLDAGIYQVGTNRLQFEIAEGALNYGHYQFRVLSGGVQNPFGVALDGDGNGAAGGDYIQEFHISPPPLGVVAFDKFFYQVEDTLVVSVGDANAVGPLTVMVTSTTGDSESVVLQPLGNGRFEGAINVTAGSVTQNDGVVQVALGTDLTVTYQDVDDGNGNPATSTDTATISNIRRYDSTDTPRNILDTSTITSVINIPDVGRIVDMNIEVDITHTWNSDLDVFLIAPDGTRVELFTDVGDSDDNFRITTLDDEALISILDGSAPFDGSFRPEGPLSAVDEKPLTGNWTLEISDDAGGDVGILHSWAIIVDVRSFDAGSLRLDRPAYNIGDEIFFEVIDSNAGSTVELEVLSSSGDMETVILTSSSPGVFQGSLLTSGDGVSAGDGVLQGQLADTIQVTYFDLNNGSGMSNEVRVFTNFANIIEFPSIDVPVAIPDNTTVTSEIEIVDGGTIRDLDVRLDITHTWNSDLEVFLLAPDGTRIELFQNVGGSDDNFTQTHLDDEASVSITAGVSPFTGFFRPVGSLSVVDTQAIAGIWTLEITDTAGGDTGSLNAWSLFIDVIPEVIVPDVLVTGPSGMIGEGHTGSTMVEFVVTLSEPTTQAVFVDYATSVQGLVHHAHVGHDYTYVADRLIFLPGETSHSVWVEVHGDRMLEVHEQFNLALMGATGGNIVGGTATATIEDDESWTLGRPLDFGTQDSPIAANGVGVSDLPFLAERGAGWSAGAETLEFRDSGVGNNLQRDYVLVKDSTFSVAVQGARMMVTVGFGDPLEARDNMRIYVQGKPVDLVSTAAGQLVLRNYDFRPINGRLNLRFVDEGGVSDRSALAYVTVRARRSDLPEINFFNSALDPAKQDQGIKLEFVRSAFSSPATKGDFAELQQLARGHRSVEFASRGERQKLEQAEDSTSELMKVSVLNEVWDELAI